MGTASPHRKTCSIIAAMVLMAVFLSGCGPAEPGSSEAVSAFRKEVQDVRNVLVPALTDAVASRDSKSVETILGRQCAVASDRGSPFTCGIAVLDRHGIILSSATPGGPVKRLDYSRYEIVMTALEERKVVKARLFLQDHSRIYVVAIPLIRNGEAVGLLGLAFDASDLRSRYRLTEEEFLSMTLD